MTQTPTKAADQLQNWVAETLSAMDMEQLVGQLLAPRAFSHYEASDSDAHHRLLRLVTKQCVGGFVLFQGQVFGQAQLVAELQSLADVPLLFGQDAEWGIGMRLDDATSFPSMAAIAATRNPDHAYNLGRVTAAEARALGVYHVYAPVVDVNSNPANPIINVRSFGEDPQLVAEMATEVIRGLNDGGVLSTAKHFPGHGDTNVDSHADLPVLPFDIERLEALEWIPFVSAIKAGVSSVMIGHLAMPAIDGEDAGPASLSKRVVTGLLRERLGFDGLVTTDAMDMHGVRKRFSAGEAAVRAVEAGIDIVMVSPDDEEAFEAIRAAVETGRISADRLEQSVRRILEAKARVGLASQDYTGPDAVRDVVGVTAHQDLARAAAHDAVTLLKNDGGLPVANENRVAVVVLNDINTGTGRTKRFLSGLRAGRPRGSTRVVEVGRTVYAEQMGEALEAADAADVVILVAVVAVRSFSGEIGLPSDHVELIEAIAARRKQQRIVLVSLGSPYIAGDLSGAVDAIVLGYGHATCVQEACAAVVRGEKKATGQLPLAVSKEYPLGSGLRLS